ncbi:polyketide biosynthesis methyltransferase [Amycolatopsis acidiphila]|uniref:Polyketide biosynthesis methyltransferase n=1 Tax=Amycolatopsis acidiphila TaxID=715473 RepID=A0A558APA1_9PSEU|nr:polyketide biosynthesis methyltransferase [Amycolatopsis acidiphila]
MTGEATDWADSLKKHLDRASSARIYDYLLNPESPNNYAIDRAFAQAQLDALPDMQKAMRENRRFIGRAVEAALEHGITQFIDIGAGLPSQGQTHEVADRVAPEAGARVVYIDNELIAHAHSEILLGRNADPNRHKAVLADFYNHGDLWRKVLATEVIDPTQPSCLLMTAIVHFMPPEDRPDVPMGVYRDRLAPGSMLVLTHVPDDPTDEGLQAVARAYSNTANPAYLRTDEEFAEFFGGWPLLEPGLVWTGEWRPKTERSQEPWWDEDTDSTDGQPWWEGSPSRMLYRAGVALKP